jgi:hypothetical protein
VMEELQRLLQNNFQWCFQRLDSVWEKCIVAQGDCFFFFFTLNILLFCISQK